MSTDPSQQHPDLTLEQRLQRLEDTVAQFHDVQQLENRVVDRLSQRLASAPPALGNIVEAANRIGITHALTVPGDVGPSSNFHTDRSSPHGWSRPLLMMDLIAEARSIVRMYVDPRYSLSWWARLVPLGLALAIFTSQIWIPGIHFMPDWIATIVSKIVDLVLAYIMYKILSREARHYRETAPELPPSLRL